MDSFKNNGSQLSPRTDSLGVSFNKDKPVSENKYKKAKRCYICEIKFDLLTKRHHCRFCGNSVWSSHSPLKRDINGQGHRIWNTCERKICEDRIRVRYESEIGKNSSELECVTEVHETLSKDIRLKNAQK